MAERSSDGLTRRNGPPLDLADETIRDAESPRRKPEDPTQLDGDDKTRLVESSTDELPQSMLSDDDPEAAIATRFSGRSRAAAYDRPTIGGYRVDRCLGHGSFGAVYLAMDDELARSVAI